MIKDNQKNFSRLHVVIDACVITLSYMFAWALRFIGPFAANAVRARSFQQYMSALVFILPAYILLYHAFSLYEPMRMQGRRLVLSNIVKEYNETNQYGNTVTVESFNYSVFESQAIQAAAAGKGPDIINCFSDQLKQHIDAGTVQPMTDYAKDFITEMGDYIYTSDKLTQSDGEIYSLPWESRVTAMWYRSDLYDSAPQSWDDLLAQSSKASTDTSLGFALGLSEDGNGTGLIETFIPWIRSAGGDFLDKDGKAVFNSDAGVKVVNFIKELVDNGSMDQTTMNMAYDDV